MKALLVVSILLLAGCGASAPTPTPTKTPIPTWTPTPTVAEAAPTVAQAAQPATATPAPAEAPTATPEAAPASFEALGEAMGNAFFDSELDAAMERAITLGPGNMTPDQLSFAVLAVVRRAPAWRDEIASGAAIDDSMEVLLDACQQIAFAASLRTDNLRVRNALSDLASGCTAVRFDAIGGTVSAASIAEVRSAVERVDALLTQ